MRMSSPRVCAASKTSFSGRGYPVSPRRRSSERKVAWPVLAREAVTGERFGELCGPAGEVEGSTTQAHGGQPGVFVEIVGELVLHRVELDG